MSDRTPNQNHVNIFEQINAISKEFRRAQKGGSGVRIEDWLKRIESDARQALFSHLLEIELKRRYRAGETPTTAEYIKRFPEFAGQVRQAFDESTMGSLELGEPASAPAQPAESDITRTLDLPALNRLGEYDLLGELGRGGFGIVYKARHRTRGNQVALKTLPRDDGQRIDANRLHKFRREFRTLSEINHPNLVGMQTLEVDGDQWFFTMDLIEGQDFLSFVSPAEQLDEQRLRDALGQLVRGVQALHSLRIVHRDLKPSNVMVDFSGRVQILDFGLVAEMQRATDLTQTRSQLFAGTPKYAAPEQMFGQRSEASDWYALGTMIYEALTGALPFTAQDPMELLRQKQQDDPPRLAEHEALPSGTEDLVKLVDGLIPREPAQRLAFEAIAEILDLASETTTRGVSATAGSAAFSGSQSAGDSSTSEMDQSDLDRLAAEEQELILIGRDGQLGELNRQFSEFCESAQPRAVWIRGRSGEGKSSLAEAFFKPIRTERRAIIFSGRCYERESIPFKALDCWIDSLVSYLRRQSDKWLQDNLPEDITGLAQIFPVLNRVETIRQMPSIENPLMTAEKLRHRAFGALRDLLLAISWETPVILFIDDLQWGDADSLAAFERIFSHEKLPQLLFLGSYRSDERDASPFLNGWDKVSGELSESAIDVEPLSEVEARCLIVCLEPAANEASDEELQRVYAESGGNPYFLWQLIEGFDREQCCFRPVPLQEMISDRLDRLPPEARPLLEFLAVAGHDLATSEVELLSGQEEKPYTALARMRNEKLIRLWGTGENQRLDVFHDKIRETVVEQLDEARRKAWHLQIGEALERRSGMVGKTCEDFQPEDPFERVVQEPIPDLFDMAWHFDAAGDPRGFDYQILAGEQALRQNSNAEAIDYLEAARQLITKDTSGTLQVRVLYGLGVAQTRSQNLVSAIDSLKQSLEAASCKSERIRIHFLLGIVYYSQGRCRSAETQALAALAILGCPQPNSFIGVSWRIFRSALRILVRPIPRRSKVNNETRRLNMIEASLLQRLGYVQFEIKALRSVDALLRSAVASYLTRNPEEILAAHARSAVTFNAIGLLRLGKTALQRIHEEKHLNLPPDLSATVNFNLGTAMYYAGDLPRATPKLETAFAAARRCGDNSVSIFAPHWIRHSRMYDSSSTAEFQAARDVQKIANQIGDPRAIFWGLYDSAEALSRSGKFFEAATQIASAQKHVAQEYWPASEVCFEGTRSFFLLQCSLTSVSRPILRNSWGVILKRTWHFSEPQIRCVPLFLESIVGQNWLKKLPKEDLREAKRLARWNRLLHRSFPLLQPNMLRSLGRLAASQGKSRKAIRYFRRSAQSAERQKMPFYLAKSLLDLAAVDPTNREANRQRAVELLKEMDSVIPRAESRLLGDQYDEAVVAPEFDLEAWEAEHGVISQPAREKPVDN